MNDNGHAVDAYFERLFIDDEPALEHVLAASKAAGLPDIAVSPTQGKFLRLLAQMIGARRVLEVGTLGGYSTLWIATGLDAGGRVVTLECERKHADVARANFEKAGLTDRIELCVGPALATLDAMIGGEAEPFDLVFIDADKQNNRAYLDAASRLTRPGGVIVLDNVVRNGRVVEADSRDPSVVGTREALQFIADHPNLSATALQTLGSKGYDGFCLVRVTS